MVDTDTGEITGASGVIRAAGGGVDVASGIGFEVVDQGPDLPGLGAFLLDELALPTGTRLTAETAATNFGPSRAYE